ncbi:MAG: helix-turn-helix domain-containing protein [Phycisphaerae bacterium]|nr:helix-turn-helix domain-containing protein [Gemmatimonadaceae bacterium]
MLHYAQHPAPPDLRPWVRLVWTMAVEDEPAERVPHIADTAELVVPDGHAELIFNIGQPFCQLAPGHDHFRMQPAAILNGQLRRSVMLRSTGGVQLVGIRLQPWALGALARVSALSLTDNWQPTDSIASRLLPNLEDALRHNCRADAAPQIVVQHLRAELRSMKVPKPRVVSVVSHVANCASSLDLAAIRRNVGLSERSMQRMFDAEVGLTTKQFAKVLRVQRVVQLRRMNARVTWARAAIDAGYYDQSHFNKDFRSVVGCAPTALMTEPDSFTGSLLATDDERAPRK